MPKLYDELRITLKKISGRPQELADISALKEASDATG